MTSSHPSTYALDRGGPAVESHLATCESCRARAAAATDIDRSFDMDVLPRTLGLVRARLGDARRRRWRPLFVATSLLAAAAAVVLVVRPSNKVDEPQPYTGLKGETPIPVTVFVKRGADVWALAPGQHLRAGDALRFVARVPRARYLELRGQDGAGHERTLFPEGARAVVVQPGEALPGGFVVDAAPGPERLVVRVSDHAFEVGRGDVAGVEVVRVELPKEP